NVSLQKVFRQIHKQAGYQFFYEDEMLNKAGLVNINVKDMPLEKVLAICFKGLPLSYSIANNVITVNRKTGDPVQSVAVPAFITIQGIVKDALGNALTGVSVIVKGSNRGTSTDTNGGFTIEANAGDVLEFSFVGYQKKSVTVGQNKNITVVMDIEVIVGSEVVVVGYGTQRKTDLTGAISTISAKEYADQPVSRIDQVLQGRAPGVQVTQNSGAPGGDVRIRIRGANSILGNNDPLYVVDGFVGADFNTVNPNDIASIQILKDAASTSIYGSRGANGVVIITTKKGTRGFKVTYEGQASVSDVIKKWDVLSAGEFADIVNKRALGVGTNPPFSTAQVDEFKKNGGTDWQDIIYRKANGQQHQVTLSGGGEKTTFLISGNYVDQKGIIENSDFKRYLFRSNLNTRVNDKLSFHVNMEGSRLLNHNLGLYSGTASPVVQTISWAPTTPEYDANGLPTPIDVTGSIGRNPLDILYDRQNDDVNSSYNVIGGLNYVLPIDGLSLDLQYGVNYLNALNSNFQGQRVSNNNPSASRSSSDQLTLQSTNALNYTRTFNKHSINAVFVFETQQYTNNSFSANANNIRFPNQLGYSNIGPNGASSVGANFQKWTLLSLLGRVNYAFENKYLLTAAVRRDGSSKFSSKNRQSVFPSVAVGWKLSEEKFIKDLNVFSNLKVRGSWGMTGSQAIGPYATISTYNTSPVFAFNNASAVSGIYQGNPGNPNLKWETTKQSDLGLEMGILEGRLNLELDYFQKNTTDLLLNFAIPDYAGGGTQTRNVGSIKNEGFEFSLGGTPVRINNFRWETNLNISTLKNRVISLGGLPRLGAGTRVGAGMSITNEFMLIPGESLGAYWGLKYLGTFKPKDAALAAQQGRFPGDPHYEDINGDNAITTDDFQIIGRAFPKVTGGWNNTFAYKALTLNIFFQGVFGVDKLDYTRAVALSGSGDARQPTLKEILNYYRPGNESSDVPAFSKTYQPFTQSSRFIENGAYVRLKNVSLSYDLSPRFIDKKFAVKLFASATNLWTITKYKGPDPEASNVGSGTDTAIGIDYGAYPNSKTYTIGINLNF
ncbi:MAG: TonB-dependent receptor, partial [Ginsengibacter sp.]